MKKIGAVISAIIFICIGLFIGTIALYANSSGFKNFLDRQVARRTGRNTDIQGVYSGTPDVPAAEPDDGSADPVLLTTGQESAPSPAPAQGSSDLYFDLSGDYDSETLEIMRALNTYADKIAESGRIQPTPDPALTNTPSVQSIPENTFFSPEVPYPLAGSDAVSNLIIPYYVSPKAYEHVGGNDWELVLNAFFDAAFNYVSVREARKYVDPSLATRVALTAEDAAALTKDTDSSIAAILHLADTAFSAHPECTSFDGTYYISSAEQANALAVTVRVDAMLLLYSSESLEEEPKTKADAVYLREVQTNEATGEILRPNISCDKLSYQITLAQDDAGSWKIVSIKS